MIAANSIDRASATTLTYDGSGQHPASPVGTSNVWSTTAADWSNGSLDVPWPASPGATADFPVGVLTAGNGPMVTINDPAFHTVDVAGINVTGSNAYNIGAAPGNTLTLTDPSITGNVNISAPITGTVGLNSVQGFIFLSGQSTYTGTTNCGSGLFLGSGAALGNTDIVGPFTAGAERADSSGDDSAGTTGPGSLGATLSTSQFSSSGVFTLQQESGFTGTALTLTNASILINIGGELVDSGPGTASVVGTQMVSGGTGFPTVPGTFTLISVPSGGLLGNFEFFNGADSQILSVNGQLYLCTLHDSDTALTETVVAVPEPTAAAVLLIGGTAGLMRRRR